jgi:hypothetical protein
MRTLDCASAVLSYNLGMGMGNCTSAPDDRVYGALSRGGNPNNVWVAAKALCVRDLSAFRKRPSCTYWTRTGRSLDAQWTPAHFIYGTGYLVTILIRPN